MKTKLENESSSRRVSRLKRSREITRRNITRLLDIALLITLKYLGDFKTYESYRMALNITREELEQFDQIPLLVLWYNLFIETATIRNGSPLYRFGMDRIEAVQVKLERKKSIIERLLRKFLNNKKVRFVNKTRSPSKTGFAGLKLLEPRVFDLGITFFNDIVSVLNYFVVTTPTSFRVYSQADCSLIAVQQLLSDDSKSEIRSIACSVTQQKNIIIACIKNESIASVYLMDDKHDMYLIKELECPTLGPFGKLAILEETLVFTGATKPGLYTYSIERRQMNGPFLPTATISDFTTFGRDIILVEQKTKQVLQLNCHALPVDTAGFNPPGIDIVGSLKKFTRLPKISVKDQFLFVQDGSSIKVFKSSLNGHTATFSENLSASKVMTEPSIDDSLPCTDCDYYDKTLIKLTDSGLNFEDTHIPVTEGKKLMVNVINGERTVVITKSTGQIFYYPML